MMLSELIPEYTEVLGEQARVEVNGIVSDSRRVQQGNLFLGFGGDQFPGSQFVKGAEARGAAARADARAGLATP